MHSVTWGIRVRETVDGSCHASAMEYNLCLASWAFLHNVSPCTYWVDATLQLNCHHRNTNTIFNGCTCMLRCPFWLSPRLVAEILIHMARFDEPWHLKQYLDISNPAIPSTTLCVTALAHFTDNCCDFLSLSFTQLKHTFLLSVSKSIMCMRIRLIYIILDHNHTADLY